jgi:hypothetical protein
MPILRHPGVLISLLVALVAGACAGSADGDTRHGNFRDAQENYLYEVLDHRQDITTYLGHFPDEDLRPDKVFDAMTWLCARAEVYYLTPAEAIDALAEDFDGWNQEEAPSFLVIVKGLASEYVCPDYITGSLDSDFADTDSPS